MSLRRAFAEAISRLSKEIASPPKDNSATRNDE